MGLIGGKAAYHFLKTLYPGGSSTLQANIYQSRSKLQALLGDEVWQLTAGRDVLDFGSGEGLEAVELAVRGARTVYGVEILGPQRARAAERAAAAGVADRVHFMTSPSNLVDVIVSLDSFEHFADPAAVLETMYESLRPGGLVLISFGPPWYHPYGGHLFSVFPWAHLLFAENALIAWRSDFKTDGATRFGEVAGGLNQMTIARFEALIVASGFAVRKLEAVPIRRLRAFATKFTRECTTSIVRATLERID